MGRFTTHFACHIYKKKNSDHSASGFTRTIVITLCSEQPTARIKILYKRKNITMIKFKTSWSVLGQDANTLRKVEELKSYLDNRLSVIKDATQSDLERVLVSFLSYGGLEFQIAMDLIPERDNELVQVCRDALVGNLLQRTKGRNGYKVREDQSSGYSVTTTGAESKFRVLTKYGSAILDDSYHDIPLDQLKTLNYYPVSSITVIKPHLQTSWCVTGEGPALRWQCVEGDELPETGLFAQIRDRAVADNWMTLAPYGEDTILCVDANQACVALRAATARATGQLFNYSVSFKDQFGRKGVTWGSKG